MWHSFVGSESIRDGLLTRGQLRWQHTAVLPRVYLPNSVERMVQVNAVAAWMWSARRGVIAGRAAAALHGARWVDDATPIEIIAEHTRPRAGIVVREERICPDEITEICGVPVTTLARTALDLARHLDRDEAVTHLDGLSSATGVTADDALALACRYRGARGLRRARIALALMDAGAQSPRETWLRLLLTDAGLPPTHTQIRSSDGVREAFIDIGYDEPKVGLDYEGVHHSEERTQYVHDIGRAELIEREGWIDIKVVAEHGRAFILHRVHDAFTRRGWTPPKVRSERRS